MRRKRAFYLRNEIKEVIHKILDQKLEGKFLLKKIQRVQNFIKSSMK